jgi:hypothetical protein
MNRTRRLGSQNEASRVASAFDVGGAPSSRSVGTCSIHFPIRVSSSGGVGSGAGSSTT